LNTVPLVGGTLLEVVGVRRKRRLIRWRLPEARENGKPALARRVDGNGRRRRAAIVSPRSIRLARFGVGRGP